MADKVVLEKRDRLTKSIIGVFGYFKTDESFQINYLQGNISIKEIPLLDIASESFKFDQVDFEEMVQRDVDNVRVHQEIIDNYLKKGENKAIFFPPLIVSLIAFDKEDKPLHKFDNIDEIITDETIELQWDSFFKLRLHRSEDVSDLCVKVSSGEELNIHKYASSIHYDENKVKLIVIDGQHRFYAIREMAKNNPDIVKDIYLPICVCFSPDALSSSDSNQDVMVNLRSMFVTINNKAKEVSGHFLDLLNDHSLASYCIRSYANLLKEDNDNSLKSKLQFLEWNQRLKNKASQINKRHSITTVSIIADTLRKEIFSENDSNSKTYTLLNLESKKELLESHPASTTVYDINDSTFDIDQVDVLKELIDENLTPCLDCLFNTPSVYASIRDRYFKALETLERYVGEGRDGWADYRDLLREFKEPNKLSHEVTRLAEKEFNKLIDLEKGIENYTRNVFQQGYIRVWAEISDYLFSEYEISPQNTAKALVSSFEKIVFNTKINLFDKAQPYTSQILYALSGKPNTSVWGKRAWKNLIMSCFLSSQTLSVFADEISRLEKSNDKLCIEEIKAYLKTLSADSINEYYRELTARVRSDFESNWRVKGFPKAFKDQLEKLFNSQGDERKRDFSKMLTEKVDLHIDEVAAPLCDILNININDLR